MTENHTSDLSAAQALLPVRDGQYTIGGSGENLLLYIEPIDSERIHERIGTERVVKIDGPITFTQGRRFQMRDQTVQGGRYLFSNAAGDIVGGLNYTRVGKNVVVSNIYVRPDCRRQGIATQLVQRALWDYPGLVVDSSLTEQGAALFGYAPGDEPKPARKPGP